MESAGGSTEDDDGRSMEHRLQRVMLASVRALDFTVSDQEMGWGILSKE